MDPIEQFKQWLDEAKRIGGIAEPTAMTLATATREGKPSARIVLLKNVDERGFVFYTNFESRKADELRRNPQAALCFHWMPLQKQVRVEGNVEVVSDHEADAYFSSRHRESQIGAWASLQSREMESREQLEKRIAEFTAQFAGKLVPRPQYWSGWRVMPERIEFWQQGNFRLHERDVYTHLGGKWTVRKLYP